MSHDDAVRARAAERYMLNALSASEAEEFERHFFDCLECCQAVKRLAVLRDNARSVWLEPQIIEVPQPQPKPALEPKPAPAPKPAPVAAKPRSLFSRILSAIFRKSA